MTTEARRQGLFVRHIALPQDHGSWVFLFSPLLIGLLTARQITPASWVLISAAVAAFLVRQPASIAVKAISGRRARRDLKPAEFWILVYGVVGLAGLAALIAMGFGYLLTLAAPGVMVFAWHLWLISRRQERRQIGIEIVGSGVLALAAPAAFWVGRGYADPQGWWLFAFCWLQSAASIVYAYLRLDQRVLPAMPDMSTRYKMGFRALLYTAFNFLATAVLAFAGLVPALLPLAFAVQLAETIYGALVAPAVGYKPTAIGFRQLAVSVVFTVVFIIAWITETPL